MEHQYLAIDHEFQEVLNQFPVLQDFLEQRHFDTQDIKEEETIEQFLGRHHYSEDEMVWVMKQMERALRRYFQGETMESDGCETINQIEGEPVSSLKTEPASSEEERAEEE